MTTSRPTIPADSPLLLPLSEYIAEAWRQPGPIPEFEPEWRALQAQLLLVLAREEYSMGRKPSLTRFRRRARAELKKMARISTERTNS